MSKALKMERRKERGHKITSYKAIKLHASIFLALTLAFILMFNQTEFLNNIHL